MQCYICSRSSLYRQTSSETPGILNTETEYITLITELRDTLYRLARSILANDSEAEDVVQDTLERVWKLRTSIAASDYPRAYVCRIAHNLAIDHSRRMMRQSSFSEQTTQTSICDGRSTTQVSDMTAITLSLISQLPEKQRLAIHMRDVEGYELSEIATMLECDETSVRMNLSRARKSIREQLLKVINYGV